MKKEKLRSMCAKPQKNLIFVVEFYGKKNSCVTYSLVIPVLFNKFYN